MQIRAPDTEAGRLFLFDRNYLGGALVAAILAAGGHHLKEVSVAQPWPCTSPGPPGSGMGRCRAGAGQGMSDKPRMGPDPDHEVGIGGAGKTRLALEVAECAGDRLPDGVVFVDLAGTAAADVARRVAEAVGAQEDDGSLLLRSLQAVLRRRRLLLILDNCERVSAVAAALVQGLVAGCLAGLQQMAHRLLLQARR